MRHKSVVNGTFAQVCQFDTNGKGLTTTFKERLTKAIEGSGQPKGEIAKAMGVHHTRVSKWLATGVMELNYLLKLPGVLGIDGHWLLTGEGEMRRQPKTVGEAALAQMFAIMDGVRRMGVHTELSEDRIIEEAKLASASVAAVAPARTGSPPGQEDPEKRDGGEQSA